MDAWVVVVVVVVVVLLLAAAVAVEAYLERHDRGRHPAPGRMVERAGHRLHLHVTGEPRDGSPTVVLDAGMVSFSSDWAWVQDEVARLTRVVSYDRAGLGWRQEYRLLATGLPARAYAELMAFTRTPRARSRPRRRPWLGTR